MKDKVVSEEPIARLICENLILEEGVTGYAGVCIASKIVSQALGSESVPQLLGYSGGCLWGLYWGYAQ